MIKNIIFDLGGVILTHKKSLIEDILSLIFNVSVNSAKSEYLLHKSDLRTGKINTKQFLQILKLKFNSPKVLENLVSEYENEYRQVALIDKDLLSLIRSISKKYNVCLMTDTLDLHDKYNSKRNIYSHFNKVFKSYEEGLIKPDIKAFLNVLVKINSLPDGCVFIDDLQENINAATGIGMIGILYKDLESLKMELRKIGVNF